jgi:hypothetical protein
VRIARPLPDRDATEFTRAVRQTVSAFQKAQGSRSTESSGPVTRAGLADPRPVHPRYEQPAETSR